MSQKNKPNELYLTRIYNAPVTAVWDAWTDPQQAAHWWGPRGFTITTHDHVCKTGGHWHYTMHGPDGTNWPNKTNYIEVEKYSRLVYDHGGNDEQEPLFRVTVQFAEHQGKTKMEMTMACPTAEAAIETKKIIKNHSGNSTWDRFAEYLEKKTSGKEQFVINRSFEVPLNTMYKMWTDPNHMSKWLPPTGFKMTFLKSDIRPGGGAFYFMNNDAGMKMFGRTQYLEMSSPNRVVYTQQFCDENEKVTRHPMAPTWPETMITVVELNEEGPNQTRVTITWEPYGPTTPEELETFIKGRSGMTQGWTGSLDKLESYLPEGMAH